jgi:aminopeptidase N
VSGRILQQFFDQWICKGGHPELEVEFSADREIARVNIKQVQQGDLFEFELEVKLAYGKDSEKP